MARFAWSADHQPELWAAKGPGRNRSVADLLQDAARVLQLRRTGPDSRIAVGRVGDIRKLGFRVVEKPLSDDPKHAEIESDTASLDQRAMRKRLANLFQFVEQIAQVPE